MMFDQLAQLSAREESAFKDVASTSQEGFVRLSLSVQVLSSAYLHRELTSLCAVTEETHI